jgi:cysteine-S-conjugate beta-lyase
MTASTNFDFDTLVERRGTASLKWDRYKDRDIIPMWLADMDFKSPPAVVKALQERAAEGVFGYTLVPDKLNDLVVAMLARDYAWQIQPHWLVWLPGLVTGLNVVCRAMGEDGDGVMTAVPIYPPFLSAPGHSRRELITVPMKAEGLRWRFDFDSLEAAITDKTRLFILCNPHNPVGRVFTRDELVRLANLCEKHDIVICSDEIHCGLIMDTNKVHIPTATLGPEVAARTITFMAPSKTFNLPGLGCAFAIISDEKLRNRFKGAMAGIVPRPNALGYAAALAAYGECGDWQAALVDYLRGNLTILTDAIETMAPLAMGPVEATYLAWIDMRASGIENPIRFFEAAGVGMQDGVEFDGPGFARLNFGCPRSILEEALARMKGALEQHRRQAT